MTENVRIRKLWAPKNVPKNEEEKKIVTQLKRSD